MKVLELFAGSRSFCKEAEKMGCETFSSDIEPFDGIDYVVNILEFDVNKVPFIPDVIHASPPCTGFSIAAIGHNWTGGKNAYIPKSETVKLGIKLAKKAIEIIEHFKRLNPNLIWYMENPRGMMRKMPFTNVLPIQNTVTYCSYKDSRMKPTDFWTNNDMWMPRKKCKNNGYGKVEIDGQTWVLNENGGPCHVAAPRGAKTGTQGLKGDYERSKIPQELCEELLNAAKLKMAYSGNNSPFDLTRSAGVLTARLRDREWFFTVGTADHANDPHLILYLKRELTVLELSMLPEYCEGARITHKVLANPMPA